MKNYQKIKYILKIFYILSFFNRKTIIQFINGKSIQTNYPLKYWIEIAKNVPFAQPHKSFLVNLNYISALQKNDIIMLNDDLIPLSRHFKRNFLEEYKENLHEVI